ncbi:hypothetical protein [Deinococcus yavapaiensis]|uniref:hypothetical protein n=1 Tax=Deinococcus yavapaiensis TaxID=309889 RepID=UPI000DA1F3FA|nr:hypothetical protein [Deinococcus yavapaiensis]
MLPRPSSLRRLALAPTLLLALGACVPRQAETPPTATASTTPSTASFYPLETGLSWSYLPEGEALTRERYVLSVTGPTLLGNDAATGYRFFGRGVDRSLYRQVNGQGQFLLGFSLPGLLVTLTPPMREYPAPSEWRAGLVWSGDMTVRVLQDGKVQHESKAEYRFTVLEQRTVTLPSGERRDVWVVNRQIVETGAGNLFPASSELWFAPYIGEVRTPESLLQVGRNYSSR